MFEVGENLSFVTESPQDEIRLESTAHDVDRDDFSILLVVSSREVDLTHSTVAKLANDPIGANATVGRGVVRGPRRGKRVIGAWRHGQGCQVWAIKLSLTTNRL
jgi:ferric-dicitrate binding protein FerR (iron transport regulator)